jgi:hypothetical protein
MAANWTPLPFWSDSHLMIFRGSSRTHFVFGWGRTRTLLVPFSIGLGVAGIFQGAPGLPGVLRGTWGTCGDNVGDNAGGRQGTTRRRHRGRTGDSLRDKQETHRGTWGTAGDNT